VVSDDIYDVSGFITTRSNIDVTNSYAVVILACVLSDD